MVEGGGCDGLLPETRHRPLVLGPQRREKLERDGALKPGILGAVDDAHPAASEAFADDVVRHAGAEERVGAVGRVGDGDGQGHPERLGQIAEVGGGLVVGRQQGNELVAERVVVAADVVEEGEALLGRHREGLVEEESDFIPGYGFHKIRHAAEA